MSIKDIDIETRAFSDKDLPSDMRPAFKGGLRKEMVDEKFAKVKFLHSVHKTNNDVWLPIEEESAGTKKLFAYAVPWLDFLNEGRILSQYIYP